MKNKAIPRIQSMKAYNPPLAGRRSFKGVLLDFNERVREPSPKVKKAIADLVKENKLHIYPEYTGLQAKIAQYAGVKTEEIMLVNGSDQGIEIVFRTFSDLKDRVMIPVPSFAMYAQSAGIVGNKVISYSYKKSDMSFPFEEVLEQIDNSVKLIVICNPNNPTATLISQKDIEKIAASAPESTIMVDECYFEYSGVTAVPLIKKYPNIVITRTFSKGFGLSALRIGYVVASKENIEELIKVRGPYDINMVSYVAAEAALQDQKNMKDYSREVMAKSKPMLEKFFKDNSIPFYKSGSNYMLFKPNDPQKTKKILEKNGILVRPQKAKIIEDTLRVSIGPVKITKQFIDTYRRYILKNQK